MDEHLDLSNSREMNQPKRGAGYASDNDKFEFNKHDLDDSSIICSDDSIPTILDDQTQKQNENRSNNLIPHHEPGRLKRMLTSDNKDKTKMLSEDQSTFFGHN